LVDCIRRVRPRVLGAACVCLGLIAPAKAGHQPGIASHYSKPQKVACGGHLQTRALHAAHKTLPCGTRVTVTNLRNKRSVTVTIRDRGPYVRGRVIDLTPTAARAIGFRGLAPVSLRW
jgi:rare lipoprotein A